MKNKKEKIVFKIPSPNFAQFCRSKNENPLSKFYNWVLTQMGQPMESKKFSLDVSSVKITDTDVKKFKEHILKWAMKDHSKTYAEQALAWEWLDIGPGQFYDEVPEEEGYVYVMSTWRKPPNVFIRNSFLGNTEYKINTQTATKKEVDALKKKYGAELRVNSMRMSGLKLPKYLFS